MRTAPENRRQHYRHAIGSEQHIKVLFQSTDGMESFPAEIVNLSIGGMCVRAERLDLMATGPWLAVFSLDAKQMRIMVKRVYSGNDPPGHGGFRFLNSADLARNAQQERAILNFLVEKQRRGRQQADDTSR